MTEKETKIAENIRRMIPLLSEQGKERLLAFSEGMAQMAELQHKSERAKEQEASWPAAETNEEGINEKVHE